MSWEKNQFKQRLEIKSAETTQKESLNSKSKTTANGKQNEVADALSRDVDRTYKELTNLLKFFCPSQIPEHFKSVHLPAEIALYLTSVLQKLTKKTQLREKHMRTKIGRGPDGENIVNPSDLKMMSTLSASPSQIESDSWEPLP